jgi:lipid II:glycine glycyltransferase (peptidoglycan interpeptide bridge formation enzyme)
MMQTIEIKTQDKKSKSFLEENKGSLLQDFVWGEFQKATGKKVWNLAVIESNSNLTPSNTLPTILRLKNNLAFYAATQIARYELPFGKCYLYCPRGPIFNFQFPIFNQFPISQFSNNQLKRVLVLLIRYIRNLAKKEKAVFLRIEPEFLAGDLEKIKVLENLGFRKSQREIQPKDTLVLDLSLSDEELLKGMHPKTRYNIRLAEKRGVKINHSVNQEDIEVFYNLLLKTAKRDNFSLHLKEYYQKQFEILGRENYLQLFLAEYQGKTIAGILVSFYNERATYLHGAHDFNFRNLMSPYLLQWQAILEARRRGCKIYDFWGIASASALENHSWQGITRFKRGFGGKEINYVGGWDCVFQPVWYWGYNLVHKIR